MTPLQLPAPSFAIVMATGILAIAAHEQGRASVAMALFVFAALAWLALVLLSCWRLARHHEHVLRDLADHQRAPAFFTAVAGTGVLASDCIVLGLGLAPALVLGATALLLWFVLTYGVFGAVITSEEKPPLERGMGGAWLLAVVACQSISVVAGLLSGQVPQPGRLQLNFLALSMWAVAGTLYTWMIGLIFYRVLFFRFGPADLAPAWWINMGAMAISALAGAQLVANAAQAPLLQGLLPFLQGFTVLYWATGTWWLPLLVALTLWRYVLRRDVLRSAHLDWSAVFPLGMYSAATHQLAGVLGLPFLRPVAALFFWVAALAWAATLAAKACSLHGARRAAAAI